MAEAISGIPLKHESVTLSQENMSFHVLKGQLC